MTIESGSSPKKRSCPICGGPTRYFYRDVEMERVFFRCGECRFIFVPEKHAIDERAHYHEQWARSAGEDAPNMKYTGFLLHVLRCWFGEPRVLDYGCGGGALVRHLHAEGVDAFGFDPHPIVGDGEEGFLTSARENVQGHAPYDVIVLTEVLEHLEAPVAVLAELAELLTADGILFVTTALVNRSLSSLQAFPFWCYIKDHTHVGFFEQATLEFLAGRLGLWMNVAGYDLVLMDKRGDFIIDSDDRHRFTLKKISKRRVMT